MNTKKCVYCKKYKNLITFKFKENKQKYNKTCITCIKESRARVKGVFIPKLKQKSLHKKYVLKLKPKKKIYVHIPKIYVIPKLSKKSKKYIRKLPVSFALDFT